MFYLYLLFSPLHNLYYIGQIQNIQNRLQRHNNNKCKFTKGKGPWILIGTKIYQTRSEVIKAELKIKKMKNRNYIVQYFKNEIKIDRGSPDS